MPAVRTLALVLRSYEVFETSKVLNLFTRELGKVTALAKGARRLRSPFQAGLDVLSVCDIVVLHKASESLDLVTEAVLSERFESLRRDLPALYAGYHIADLLNELTGRHDPHPRLFDAAVITLRYLGEEAVGPGRLLRFELACLRELGLRLALEDCVHCGNRVDDAQQTVAFALSSGGVLCAACRPGQPHVATLSADTLVRLRLLSDPGSAWRELDYSVRANEASRRTVGAVLSHMLGRPPRLLPYLNGP